MDPERHGQRRFPDGRRGDERRPRPQRPGEGPVPRTLTLQTQTEAIVLDRSEIESQARPRRSLMPDGLLDTLKPDEIRDLIAYLSHPTQVPLPQARTAKIGGAAPLNAMINELDSLVNR